MTSSRVLCLNSGSSSLKFALYQMDPAETPLASGAIEDLGAANGRLWVRDEAGHSLLDEPRAVQDTPAAVATTFAVLGQLHLPVPSAVGHRVVFGGSDHVEPERVDAALIDKLKALARFAPLHVPVQVAAIEAAIHEMSDVPHVACFDTAFHRRMPEIAQRLPLPRPYWDEGIRRYGFHGLSYEFIVSTLGGATLRRAVIAHLGHGASMAAVRNMAPIDTTMGLTPTGGFMMSTRTGDVDPGVMLYLARERQLDPDALERLVTRESGLLGISGSSGDMQELLARRGSDSAAAQAIDMFCYQTRKQIGAYAAALGGLDTLVFTGGIGERAASIRRDICSGLEHLGIDIDQGLNDRHAEVISASRARCTVRVVPTNENLMIARHTHALTNGLP